MTYTKKKEKTGGGEIGHLEEAPKPYLIKRPLQLTQTHNSNKKTHKKTPPFLCYVTYDICTVLSTTPP